MGEIAITIIVNLDVMLARRKMKLTELSEAVGISIPNLSILKTGKAKAIRLSTLDAICRVLECQPGDILEHRSDPPRSDATRQTTADDSKEKSPSVSDCDK